MAYLFSAIWHAMSLRLRLVLVVTSVIVVHAGVRIVLLAQDARDSAHQAQQVQGEWVGKSLANTLTNPLIANDLATVQSTVELLYSEKAFLQLAVRDDRDRTIIDLRPGAGKTETDAPAWFTSFLDIVPEPSIQPIDIEDFTHPPGTDSSQFYRLGVRLHP